MKNKLTIDEKILEIKKLDFDIYSQSIDWLVIAKDADIFYFLKSGPIWELEVQKDIYFTDRYSLSKSLNSIKNQLLKKLEIVEPILNILNGDK